jgi:meiotically up-regulated gene 157 (Mug157) protein
MLGKAFAGVATGCSEVVHPEAETEDVKLFTRNWFRGAVAMMGSDVKNCLE